MVALIPPPDVRSLLPPILACLPTAFVSPRPPPALLPLLSPILRQRVQFQSLSSGSSDSWISLLCWESRQAAKLPAIVEHMHIEPHPVSGEVEIEDVQSTRFRRLDEETLQARVDVEQFGLSFVYLWCMADQQAQSGWLLAELRALEDGDDGEEWYDSIPDANDGCGAGHGRGPARAVDCAGSNAGADDDYWASYDQTPGTRTAKSSPAPPFSSSALVPSNTELEYFARYMSEVQPAMDPHDPSEQGLAPGESTLHGNSVVQEYQPSSRVPLQSGSSRNTSRHDSTLEPIKEVVDLDHPRPSSSSSHGSVDRLEHGAQVLTQAEVAIKQHISTDLKSLFRLARNAGIQREEFERIVKTELDCMSVMDLDA